MAESALRVEGLAVELGGREVLSSVSLSVDEGCFLALVGPNGSGKTTLLRALFGAVTPKRGEVFVFGRPLRALSRRELGATFAVLRQEPPLAFEFLVEELVVMGRSPHKRWLEGQGAEDRAIVAEALAFADVAHLAGRRFSSLSGGEKQRVLLARALAQRPRILLLDEPTNHLDIRHQLDVLGAVQRLGLTVIAALHDLNLALTYASQAALLVGGTLRRSGPVRSVLTPEAVREVFGVEARLFEDDRGPTLAFGPTADPPP